MARPKDADSAQTYDAIVTRALEVLDESDDPRSITLREVARRSEMSLGTIHYYFPTKDALLEACLDGYYQRLRELGQTLIARAAVDAPKDSRALVELATREFYRFSRKERGSVRLRLVTNAMSGELSPARQHEFLGTIIRSAADVLAPFVGVEGVRLRLVIQSMSYLVAHMATLTDAEMLALTDLEGEAGRSAVEDHVVSTAWRMVRPD